MANFEDLLKEYQDRQNYVESDPYGGQVTDELRLQEDDARIANEAAGVPAASSAQLRLEQAQKSIEEEKAKQAEAKLIKEQLSTEKGELAAGSEGENVLKSMAVNDADTSDYKAKDHKSATEALKRLESMIGTVRKPTTEEAMYSPQAIQNEDGLLADKVNSAFTPNPMEIEQANKQVENPYTKPKEEISPTAVESAVGENQASLAGLNLPKESDYPMPPVAPIAPKSKAEQLMEQLANLKKEREGGLSRSKWADFGQTLGQSLATYGAQKGDAEAMKYGSKFKSNLKFAKPTSYKNALAKYDKQEAQLRKDVAALEKQGIVSKVINTGTEMVLINNQGKQLKSYKMAEKPKTSKESKFATEDGQPLLFDGKNYRVPGKKEVYQGNIVSKKTGVQQLSMDPNSPEAKNWQDQWMAKLSASGITLDEKQIADIRKQGPFMIKEAMGRTIAKTPTDIQKERLSMSEKRRLFAEKKFANLSADQKKKYQEAYESQITKSQDKIRTFLKHKTGTEILANIPMLKSALAAAENGEETALAVLGVKMAKVMGERGMLSESDVTRYTGAASLKGKLRSMVDKYSNAEISKEVGVSVKNLMNEMNTSADALIDQSIMEQANNFSKAEGVPLQHAIYLLDYRKKSKNLGEQQEPGLEKAAQKSPMVMRRKTADGRVALFDENKKFIGYEE